MGLLKDRTEASASSTRFLAGSCVGRAERNAGRRVRGVSGGITGETPGLGISEEWVSLLRFRRISSQGNFDTDIDSYIDINITTPAYIFRARKSLRISSSVSRSFLYK